MENKMMMEEIDELFVGEKQKVYVKERNFLKSFVLNILTEDCFLNPNSLDHIGQLSFKASANTGMSLSCISCLASDSNFLHSFGEIVEICLTSSLIANPICSKFSFEYLRRSDLLFFNSSKLYSEVDNLSPSKSEFIIINLTGFSLKNENNMLVSTINCIFYQPSFFNLSQAFCFTSFPNLKQSSSVSSEFSSILSSFLSNNALLIFSDKNCLIASEKFNSGNSSNLAFSSLGMDSVMFGIFELPVCSVKDVEVFKSFGEKVLANLSDFKLKNINCFNEKRRRRGLSY